jgi:Uma2 family endonuclease
MSTLPQPRYSVQEFLAIDERTFDKRLELHDGQVLELENATPNHGALCSRIGFLLNGVSVDSGCQVFDGSVNIYIESAERVIKPDATVLCGQMQTITGIEGVGAAILNPTIVIEVLSPDSINFDKGEKADLYRTLPSLRHYILISQTKVEVQQYSRLGETTWQLTKLTNLADNIQLQKPIQLSDLYAGIDLSSS